MNISLTWATGKKKINYNLQKESFWAGKLGIEWAPKGSEQKWTRYPEIPCPMQCTSVTKYEFRNLQEWWRAKNSRSMPWIGMQTPRWSANLLKYWYNICFLCQRSHINLGDWALTSILYSFLQQKLEIN